MGKRLAGGRWTIVVVLLLAVGNLACGLGGVTATRNNGIRRQVVAHELAVRGPADELMVAFGAFEVRANLGFTTGNTVWLQPVAQAEYLRQRDTRLSYIFIHRPEVDDQTATVVVDRGTRTGALSYRLTLQKEGAAWSVTGDVPVEPESSL